MERGKERMDFERMHGGLDNSRRDGIHSHAIFGIFYRQGFRRGVQRTLGERCEDSRHAAHRLVNQAGSDSYDMTTPRLAHQLHRTLGHMKEACDIGGDVVSVFVIRIGGERLGHERAGVVDQRIDAAEAIQRLLEDPIRRFRVGNIPLHRHDVLIMTRFDGSRSGNDTVVATPECLNERCPNSL